MHELKNVKMKLVEALEEMGKNGQAMNDPAVDRICRISKALMNISTFETMEEDSGEKRSERARRSYASENGSYNGSSYGNDWEHGGDYREQTSRGSYHGSSYADRTAARDRLARQLDGMAISREERERILSTVDTM